MTDLERVILGLLAVATYHRPGKRRGRREVLDLYADDVFRHAMYDRPFGVLPRGWRYLPGMGASYGAILVTRSRP